jgi:hypothetical protein
VPAAIYGMGLDWTRQPEEELHEFQSHEKVKYGHESFSTASKELSKYKLDLVGVQEIRREGSGNEPAEYTFFNGKGNENHELCRGFLCIRDSLRGTAFVSDRMSYIILRDRWCHVIVLNVHAATENKSF